jgi:hypothetical protein
VKECFLSGSESSTNRRRQLNLLASVMNLGFK